MGSNEKCIGLYTEAVFGRVFGRVFWGGSSGGGRLVSVSGPAFGRVFVHFVRGGGRGELLGEFSGELSDKYSDESPREFAIVDSIFALGVAFGRILIHHLSLFPSVV